MGGTKIHITSVRSVVELRPYIKGNNVEIGISLLYRIGYDLWNFISRKRRKLSISEIAKRREEWRGIFEKEVHIRHARGLRKDLIIHDVKRIDEYPDIDKKSKGISSWFRVGLVGT